MTQPEKSKQPAPVEASSPADRDRDDTRDDDDPIETPMLAVWLSLGLILVAGLYGLYLGTNAKAKAKEGAAATSALIVPAPERVASNDRLGQAS